MHKYKVDLAIWSHVHNYERLWPVYKGKTYVDNIEEPYRNPKAIVQIVTGAAVSNIYMGATAQFWFWMSSRI